MQENEVAYFKILCLGGGAYAASYALSGFFSGRGKTWPVLWVNVATTVVNLVLDYALIFGHWGFPELGIVGAGIATVAAQKGIEVVLKDISAENAEKGKAYAAAAYEKNRRVDEAQAECGQLWIGYPVAGAGAYRVESPLNLVLALGSGIEAPDAVVHVDDGVATGFTALKAVDFVRRRGAEHIVLAVPVIAREAAAMLAEAVEIAQPAPSNDASRITPSSIVTSVCESNLSSPA